MTWDELKILAIKSIPKEHRRDYIDRFKYEVQQIELQGAADYWIDLYEKKSKYDSNPNGIVLAFLVGITDVDPIKNGIPHNIEYQPDFPDIDIDFLPIARDPIKKYASDEYGADKVCSVGLWQTYKPKLAIIDTCRALGINPSAAMKMTKTLPQEFDDMEFEEAYEAAGCEAFKEFVDQELDPDEEDIRPSNKEIVTRAYKMVKLIKAQGRHAGGLIISSVPVKDHIPLTKSGGQWTSAWTEGRSTQLSKFGFVKFDILGLTNLLHIWYCKKFIKNNHGVTINFDDMDPEEDRAGWEILPDGSKHRISFNDEPTMAMADQLKVDTIFQFDTDLAKSILARGKVKSFNDLVIYTSLGRPGPLPLVDEYIQRRDEAGESWKEDEDPRIAQMLEDTYGIIVFQEQLSKFFIEMCGFTIPEAEAARKAVAKKWADKLAKIKDKMVAGATKTIGMERALEWWQKIESFARYCFNKSHALAYIIISYRSLWLKCHYAPEWWAAVMSNCHPDKRVSYMGIARSDGIKFSTTHFKQLHRLYSVSGDIVYPGLESIKGIGTKAAEKMSNIDKDYNNLGEMVATTGKSKTVYERLIKLGAFDEVHPNRKALWHWYLYKYGSCATSKKVKEEIKTNLAWPDSKIEAERSRMTDEYFKQYPNRKKIPNKILKWKPKISASLVQMEGMYEDYSYEEKLEFERTFLGYYNSSPMKLYEVEGYTIAKAREEGILECIIEEARARRTETGNEYVKLRVTDGIEHAVIMIWSNALHINDEGILQPDVGVRFYVKWNDKFRSFNVKDNSIFVPLQRLDDAFTD